MPKVDDKVVCIFAADGDGICLNGYFHESNLPEEIEKYSYFKRLSENAIIGVDKASGDVIIIANKIRIKGDLIIEGNINASGSVTSNGEVLT